MEGSKTASVGNLDYRPANFSRLKWYREMHYYS